MSSRRRFLTTSFKTGLAAAPALYFAPGLFADELAKTLARTPAQTEGPFYPDRLPLDTDNDLLRLNTSSTPALGQVSHLSGRVLTTAGEPVRNATVEIWQADNNGNYIHSRGGSADGERPRDAGFQGFGRFLTDAEGRYYFRTIKPVPYGGRAPHIHMAVDRGGDRLLTTQCYIKGHPMNARDGVMRRTAAEDRAGFERLQIDFAPLPDSAAEELKATFDVVLGEAARGGTPADVGAADPGEMSRPVGRRLGRGFEPVSQERALDLLLGPAG